jgi:hypothetical protein
MLNYPYAYKRAGEEFGDYTWQFQLRLFISQPPTLADELNLSGLIKGIFSLLCYNNCIQGGTNMVTG